MGRIVSGRVKREAEGPPVKGPQQKNVAGSIDSVMVFDKLGRTEVEAAEAGDIVAIVGLGSVDIGDTIADPENLKWTAPAAHPKIDEPTLEHALHSQ